MAFSDRPFPEPGALVKRFSGEVMAKDEDTPGGLEFNRARLSFINEQDEESKTRKAQLLELNRINDRLSEQRPADAAIFQDSYQKLAESMENFRKANRSTAVADGLARNWEDVKSAVTEVQVQWDKQHKETRTGQAKELIRRMGNAMNNHSNALKMLPSEGNYMSVISGSVTMLIRASANHINITEDFARGMVAINDYVYNNQMSRGIYKSQTLATLTMRMYTHIFRYLEKLMHWYTANFTKRFRLSFNETLPKTFQTELDQVKETSHVLALQVQTHMSVDARITRLFSEESSSDFKYLINMQEQGHINSEIRDRALADYIQHTIHNEFQKSREQLKQDFSNMMEQMRHEMAGVAMADLLTAQVPNMLLTASPKLPTSGHSNASVPQFMTLSTAEATERQMELDQTSTRIQWGADIKRDAAHVEQYFKWEDVYPFSETPEPLLADPALVYRLGPFAETMKSSILYAQSHFLDEGSNHLRRTAAGYIALAQQSRLPVVSYFCSLQSNDPPAQRTKESVETVALMSSLIRQITRFLPAELPREAPRFDAQRFFEIDGTLRTWSAQLDLFVDLVKSVGLPHILFVIDGLNVLDDDFEDSTTAQLDRLVKCFRYLVRSSASENFCIKIFFTSAGASGSLCRELDDEEVVLCDGSSPSGGNRKMRSRQFMNY